MTTPALTPTPAENLRVVLGVCAGVDDYTRFCAVLTGFAESDFRSDVVQHGRTFGVFQQTDAVNSKGVPFWPTAHGTTADQCRAFIADFQAKARFHDGRPERDSWLTQQWSAPDPRLDYVGFMAAPETRNYTRRLPDVPRLIAGR